MLEKFTEGVVTEVCLRKSYLCFSSEEVWP